MVLTWLLLPFEDSDSIVDCSRLYRHNMQLDFPVSFSEIRALIIGIIESFLLPF